MAYFSNSSDGSALDEMCSKCVHLGPENGPGCRVLLLQLDWNYEQDLNGDGDTGAKAKKRALDLLIPQTVPEGKPVYCRETKCSMFFPVELLSDRGKFEIGKADKAAQDRLKLEEWNKLYGNNSEVAA